MGCGKDDDGGESIKHQEKNQVFCFKGKHKETCPFMNVETKTAENETWD